MTSEKRARAEWPVYRRQNSWHTKLLDGDGKTVEEAKSADWVKE